MPRPSTVRKAKKTFSLSKDAVRYLESVRKEKKRRTISSVLEDMIRQQQQAGQLERISSAVTRYYDSISEEQREEDGAWGRFAESQFVDEDQA
jgi:hypothetical protein